MEPSILFHYVRRLLCEKIVNDNSVTQCGQICCNYCVALNGLLSLVSLSRCVIAGNSPKMMNGNLMPSKHHSSLQCTNRELLGASTVDKSTTGAVSLNWRCMLKTIKCHPPYCRRHVTFTAIVIACNCWWLCGVYAVLYESCTALSLYLHLWIKL